MRAAFLASWALEWADATLQRFGIVVRTREAYLSAQSNAFALGVDAANLLGYRSDRPA